MLRTASDLYALSQSLANTGSEECHWCGSRCERKWPHDDDPPIPFQRSVSTARRPANAWVCNGCRNYREPRRTVWYLSGGFSDRKSLCDFSWLLTPDGIQVIEQDLLRLLYPVLLSPL